MINLSLLLLSFVLYIQFEQVFSVSQTSFNEDVMVVEGNNCNSSEIKLMLIDRNVSKIHIFLTHTFYADEDLKLNGIVELQIFADTWHCTQPVVFDLSGTNGANQESPEVKGSPGSKGNDGKNGGNFLGLTNHIINGDHLRVKSNGGNGGDGQNGAASDDVYVLLSVENDTGDSGWFSSGDLQSYYKKYFNERGYDAEISGIDDYTSFYAVFVHDKKASFNIRLHPRECCGTTGVGGPGGLGGRRGTFVFKHLGKSHGGDRSETIPTFVGFDGKIGKLGTDGVTCENRALDISVDVELKKVVFIIIPLHHSFTSKFTVLNHTNSSKCSTEYVRSNITTAVKLMDTNDLDVVSAIVHYKTFLLESMENESQKSMAQAMYEVIDSDWDINKENSLKGLLKEGYELERRYIELKKTVDVIPLYKRLYDRVESKEDSRKDDDEERARWRLRSILEFKLIDIETEHSLIVNLQVYTEVALSILDIRNRRLSTISRFNDVDLQHLVNRLQFEVNGKFILAEYEHVIKGFQLTYFPFAVEYLDTYDIPAALSDYKSLDDLHSTAFNKIVALNETIRRIESKYEEFIMNINYIDYSPSYPFYVWKNSDIRNIIRKLFAGEKITLLADVKHSKLKYNALKFNKIDLYFRSSDKSVTNELNNLLKYFAVELKHDGRSGYQCDNNFYQIITPPFPLSFSFEKNKRGVPVTRLLTYDKLSHNEPTLSPFASWEIQIVAHREKYFSQLAAFATFPIDIELHGTGTYVWGGLPVCENKDLEKIYTRI